MKKPTKTPTGRVKLLARLSLFTFDNARPAIVLWLALTLFGVLSYTTFLKREGFPSVDIPFSVISGAYFVNDAKKVDGDVAKLITDAALKNEQVSSVRTTAHGTFYTVFVQYKEGTDADKTGKVIEDGIKTAGVLPKQATMQFTTPKFGFTERGDDAVVSIYATKKGQDTDTLLARANEFVTFAKARSMSTVADISVIDPYVKGVNPLTGQAATTQATFDRYGLRQDQQSEFYDAVAVGTTQKKGSDVIEFDEQLRSATVDFNKQDAAGYMAAVSAGYAPQIKEQIGELQGALLEGLLAVLLVGSIVIAIRASLITVLSMLTVLAATIGLLLGIGYTLNTITLFALILCLALIVDDTIIMVEAIDAQRRRRKDPRETIQIATSKISRAMVAATFTAVLSFTPLLFTSGILGSFIRAIPTTVISSLLISLLVALIFIPVFARYLLLGKKQMGAENVHEPAAGIEAKIAHIISGPMLWARGSTKKLWGVGLGAVMVGVLFVGAGGFFFQKVTFNIFPPTKDTNGLIVQLEFPAGTSIKKALEVAQKSDELAGKRLGENFVQSSYYATGKASGASLFVEITPYNKRDVRSPQLVEQLKEAYKGFEGARVSVSQQDVGPPSSPFTVRIESDNLEASDKLALAMANFLKDKELTRPSGEKAKITSVTVSDPAVYSRIDGKQYVQVSATFDGTDTTTLVTLAQTAIEKEFTPEKVVSYGLNKDALQFDFGQESENQDSFKTLALAFPIVLLVIYILLAFQFRSLIQPLMIFTAIPFSLFGITLGLYTTDNAFSFFAMLGFFALIGLSLKNTILLTDYANQQRRAGVSAVDAAVEALGERFRPLIATSLTAVVSLIPLAFMSPFWEGLAVVLIFGLLSSTLLVILVFPYYYLGVEFLRMHISRTSGLIWFFGTVAVTIGLAQGKLAQFAPLVSLLLALGLRSLSKRQSLKPQAVKIKS
jgi:multidrug efflux pump subunit AcrB